MFDWLTIWGFISIIIAFLIHQFAGQKKRYPPGPWGFPIVGHLFHLGASPHKTLMNWKAKYGPIVSVRFGSFPTVAVSDAKLIRTIMNDVAFSGRPDIESFKHRSGGKRHGILFGDGTEWQEQRRFTIKHLREFGFGKNSMESILQAEIAEVIQIIARRDGEPQKLRPIISVAVINSIWILITGNRFEHTDETLHNMLKAISDNLEKFNGLSAICMFLPWFTKIAPKLSGFDEMNKDLCAMLEFLNGPLNEHKKSIEYGTSRDLIDAYLNEIDRCTDRKSSFHRDNDADRILITVCLDLFTAGAETTTTTAVWMFLYLALHPRVQAEAHEEIDRVVGKCSSRLAGLDDRQNMPYMHALIYETLRFSTLVPTGLFKNTICDVELEGYLIPKDTMILTNLYEAHYNEEYWGDPHTFRPERFLVTNPETGKKTLAKHDPFFLAFLCGKRSCLGEDLSKAELFIFCTNLLQRFTVSTDPNAPEPSIDPIVSTVAMPRPHDLIFRLRN